MGVTRKNDPQKTRQDVLDAAIRLFSAKGFAATSIADIAKEAAVGKSLVLYHFSTKEELWQQALEAHLWPMVELLIRYAMGDPHLRLVDVLRKRFELMRDAPDLARMIRWMTLDSAPIPKAVSEIVPRVVERGMSEMEGLVLPEGVFPELLFALAMGACDSWFAYRNLYSAVSGLELSNTEADERFFDTLVALLPPALRGEHHA